MPHRRSSRGHTQRRSHVYHVWTRQSAWGVICVPSSAPSRSALRWSRSRRAWSVKRGRSGAGRDLLGPPHAECAREPNIGVELGVEMAVLIRHGEIITSEERCFADIYIEDETITQIGPDLAAPAGTEVIDAAGKMIFPGFIDPHVHIHLPFMG